MNEGNVENLYTYIIFGQKTYNGKTFNFFLCVVSYNYNDY